MITAVLNFPEPVIIISDDTIEVEYIGPKNPFAFKKPKNEEPCKTEPKSTCHTGGTL